MFVVSFDKGKLKKNKFMGGERENCICIRDCEGGGVSRVIIMGLIF